MQRSFFHIFRCGLFSAFCFLSLTIDASAQQPAALTPDQQATLTAAQKDFAANRWSDALVKMKALHEQVPGNMMVTEGTAETAITAGDSAYALQLLKPLGEAHPEEWQPRTFLARVYAESHQDALRDAELSRLLTMHKSTTDSNFQRLTQILIERDPTAKGHVDLYYSLEPWSQYKIYEMARVYDASGKQVLRVTLESSDFDQPMWVKNHPQQAAAGMRMFSMDGYSEPVAGPNGTQTQTHLTYAFFDGRPSYNEVRDRMISIADGKTGPVSNRTGIPMPVK